MVANPEVNELEVEVEIDTPDLRLTFGDTT